MYRYSDYTIGKLNDRIRAVSAVLASVFFLSFIPAILRTPPDDPLPSGYAIVAFVIALSVPLVCFLGKGNAISGPLSSIRFKVVGDALHVIDQGRRKTISIPFRSITKMRIGNMNSPGHLELQIEYSKGKEFIVRNLANMEEFLKEVRQEVRAPIEYLQEDLPILTKSQRLMVILWGALYFAVILYFTLWADFTLLHDFVFFMEQAKE